MIEYLKTRPWWNIAFAAMALSLVAMMTSQVISIPAIEIAMTTVISGLYTGLAYAAFSIGRLAKNHWNTAPAPEPEPTPEPDYLSDDDIVLPAPPPIIVISPAKKHTAAATPSYLEQNGLGSMHNSDGERRSCRQQHMARKNYRV